MLRLTLAALITVGLCSEACSGDKPEPLPAPKLKAEPQIIVVRPLTLIERIRERQAARLADRVVRLQEVQARSLAAPVVVRGWIWIR